MEAMALIEIDGLPFLKMVDLSMARSVHQVHDPINLLESQSARQSCLVVKKL